MTQLGVQIGYQRYQQPGRQLDETLITQQGGKLAVQVALDVLGVIGASRSGSGTAGTG